MFRGLRFAGLLLSALRFPRGIFCAQAKCFALPLFCSSALAQSQLQLKLLLFFLYLNFLFFSPTAFQRPVCCVENPS